MKRRAMSEQSGNAGGLKPCPLCGGEAHMLSGTRPCEVICSDLECPMYDCETSDTAWQALPRPPMEVRNE